MRLAQFDLRRIVVWPGRLGLLRRCGLIAEEVLESGELAQDPRLEDKLLLIVADEVEDLLDLAHFKEVTRRRDEAIDVQRTILVVVLFFKVLNHLLRSLGDLLLKLVQCVALLARELLSLCEQVEQLGDVGRHPVT